jgi:signal peptidase I
LRLPFAQRCWGREIKRGDVVIFKSPEDGKRCVKRVVGLPGETLEMKNNRLAIDKIPVSMEDETERLFGHPHAVQLNGAKGNPLRNGASIVPDDHYFLMGDNRDNSSDSRVYGAVHRNQIYGQARKVMGSIKDETRKCHAVQ